MAIQAIHVRKVNYIVQLYDHCIVTWYAMPQSLVKLTEIGTSWGVARQLHKSRIIQSDNFTSYKNIK